VCETGKLTAAGSSSNTGGIGLITVSCFCPGERAISKPGTLSPVTVIVGIAVNDGAMVVFGIGVVVGEELDSEPQAQAMLTHINTAAQHPARRQFT
jgi:hypothetical protein